MKLDLRFVAPIAGNELADLEIELRVIHDDRDAQLRRSDDLAFHASGKQLPTDEYHVALLQQLQPEAQLQQLQPEAQRKRALSRQLVAEQNWQISMGCASDHLHILEGIPHIESGGLDVALHALCRAGSTGGADIRPPIAGRCLADVQILRLQLVPFHLVMMRLMASLSICFSIVVPINCLLLRFQTNVCWWGFLLVYPSCIYKRRERTPSPGICAVTL